jgi:glyoxylase-like metal-dependent hydrolase (beta-lactamase superfamily II)
MKEIVPDVFTWPWFSERHGYDFNGYLVRHPGGNLCIDPVDMSDDVLDEIAAVGVSRILLTNRNHTRASAKVSRRTGAKVAIHPADAAHARAQGAVIDEELWTGEKIGPLVVVAADGKSAGEVAFHWPERKILIVGDACVGKPPGACALLVESVMDDPSRLRSSLRRIAEQVDFDVLLVGDGTPILQNARQALRTLVATFA